VNERILVTAGPTQEFIDPVRCITNRSSGKMGYAIAKMARRRGADVILVTGKTYVPPPRLDIYTVEVTTAMEMRNAVLEHQRRCSVIIMAAAVADYRCREENCLKIKKIEGQDGFTLELSMNPDILKELGAIKGNKILVGFAAETNNVVENAVAKLKSKNLDLIVANDVTKEGIGFGSDRNEVTIIDRSGRSKHVPQMTKDEVAHLILDAVRRVAKKRKVEDDWL
jgi:phosphopantothenoylcysteine decarboxylase/phosphopantothenate--cysteine ligase